MASITKKNLTIQTFRSGGNGGQNQNKRDTGVRIIHRDSGAVGESRESRNQLVNKKLAFKRMVAHPKMKIWIAKQANVEEIDKSSTRRYTYKGKNISLETRKMDRE